MEGRLTPGDVARAINDALAFYADARNWEQQGKYPPAAVIDAGMKARRARDAIARHQREQMEV